MILEALLSKKAKLPNKIKPSCRKIFSQITEYVDQGMTVP